MYECWDDLSSHDSEGENACVEQSSDTWCVGDSRDVAIQSDHATVSDACTQTIAEAHTWKQKWADLSDAGEETSSHMASQEGCTGDSRALPVACDKGKANITAGTFLYDHPAGEAGSGFIHGGDGIAHKDDDNVQVSAYAVDTTAGEYASGQVPESQYPMTHQQAFRADGVNNVITYSAAISACDTEMANSIGCTYSSASCAAISASPITTSGSNTVSCNAAISACENEGGGVCTHRDASGPASSGKHVTSAEDAAAASLPLQADDFGTLQGLVARSLSCLDSGTPDTLQALRYDITVFAGNHPSYIDACKQLIVALRSGK